MKTKRKIALSVVPTMVPVPEVIERLEQLLIRAKAGEIKAIAIAYVTPADPYTASTSGLNPTDVHSAKLLLAAMDELRHEWKHAVRGK